MKMSRQRAILLAMSLADKGTSNPFGASSEHNRRAVPTVAP